ncbi:hypothetical protein CAEBREN_12813 [Caenorhabditis brenneri]|uniref:DNA-directed DNA polymerase n=1 Tax=Caenorhabditis brenneri TaxID=135651 RepID=G0NDZ8_CAEBE|nr:hypothetical protein CAEBREN_12813 [Caenorhabditis brenneri]
MEEMIRIVDEVYWTTYNDFMYQNFYSLHTLFNSPTYSGTNFFGESYTPTNEIGNQKFLNQFPMLENPRYDAEFILRSLISGTKASPSVIMAGTKIISLKHRGVKLIDSLKYLTMSLAAVGKAFRIPTEKGDFPVKFIKRENFDYKGDLPGDEYYNLQHKTPAARQKLIDFLEEERAQGKQFDFADELLKYCYSDVFILASSLVSLEKDFEAETDVCLFEETTTAASAAMKVF